MNITYLIGNGFDISIGLDTRYKDFYNYLLENNDCTEGTSNNIIEKINDDELWSDLEMALGDYVESIVTEEDLNIFMIEKNEIENKLKEYLKIQQERIIWDQETLDKSRVEFDKAVKDFSFVEDSFDNEFIQEMSKALIFINIINFNYTNIIKKIANVNKELLYLHGTLDANIILGVNDAEQIKNNKYKNTEDMVLSMCKREMMNHDSKKRFENAKELLNENTDYVFMYGISIGETDRFWWDLIVNALMEGKIKKVVIFWYDADIDSQFRTRVRKMQEDVKNKFLGKRHRENNIRNNIEVIINSPIFNSVQSIIKDSIEKHRALENIGNVIINRIDGHKEISTNINNIYDS